MRRLDPATGKEATLVMETDISDLKMTQRSLIAAQQAQERFFASVSVSLFCCMYMCVYIDIYICMYTCACMHAESAGAVPFSLPVSWYDCVCIHTCIHTHT